MTNKQTSISGVRTVEFDPETHLYVLKGIDDVFIDNGIKGKIDSIYHDGPHKTTFTITFNTKE